MKVKLDVFITFVCNIVQFKYILNSQIFIATIYAVGKIFTKEHSYVCFNQNHPKLISLDDHRSTFLNQKGSR